MTGAVDHKDIDVHGLPRGLPDGPTRDAVESARKIINTDGKRVRIWTFAAAVAMNFPRRLGPDASADAMALDKKISKKVCHLYYMLWMQMSSQHETAEPPVWGQWDIASEDPQIRQLGSTVIWGNQLYKLSETAQMRIETVNEHPCPIKAVKKWQRRRLHLLRYELDGILRIQKLLPT